MGSGVSGEGLLNLHGEIVRWRALSLCGRRPIRWTLDEHDHDWANTNLAPPCPLVAGGSTHLKMESRISRAAARYREVL